MNDRYLIGLDLAKAEGVFGKSDQMARTFTKKEVNSEAKKMPFKPVVIYKLVKVMLVKPKRKVGHGEAKHL